MQQDFIVTKAPTTATTFGGGKFGGDPWSSPTAITVDDTTSATWYAYSPGQEAVITGAGFGFSLPAAAVIDGIQILVKGSQFSSTGDIFLNVPGTTGKPYGALNGTFGSFTDKWGATTITVAQLAALTVSVNSADISGGDAQAAMQYMSVTVYYHLDLVTAPADVPTRIAYKVYSRAGKYLGELPNVETPFAFPQDINSAGSTIQIKCGKGIQSGTTTDQLLTESGLPLQTEAGEDILATVSTNVIARGDSDDEVIFKNSNRVKVWVYNYWHPNGKLEFSGQINRVGFEYGNGAAAVNLTIISDGLDLGNFIARGYPFVYTNDAVQTTQNGFLSAFMQGGKGSGWLLYGQSFTVGAAVNNMGAIALMVQGTADITMSLYDAPNGNFMGSITKSVNDGSPTVEQFNFPQLIDIAPSTTLFFGIWLGEGQSLNIYRNTGNVYGGGTAYESSYSGGSGGGSWGAIAGDLYFVTKYGTPTTSITFNSKDPVTNMAADVLLDYNTRGGYIKRRNFQATGLSLSYPFNMATVFDVIKKAIELSPTGFCSYIDLGTAEIDIFQMSETADYTIVKGRHVNSLSLAFSIEQVKNYLLFTGGELPATPGQNLYREYPDPLSTSYYGPRYTPKSDNRVILVPTANAIGQTFIEENAGESQETQVTVLNTTMDISLLTPGKTIGFKNFGNILDDMVLPIVRREPNFSKGYSVLTLGRLPVRQSDEIQRINRELLNEQTINNPSAPS